MAPSGADPSIGTTSSGIAPLAVGRVDGADVEVHPITMVTEDASVAFFPGYADPVNNDTVASSYATYVMGAVISIRTYGDPICAISTCGVAVTPGYDLSAPGTTTSTCGVIAMPSCAASPVDAPCMPSSVCPSTYATVATDVTPTVDAMAVPMPLPLSVAPAEPRHLH